MTITGKFLKFIIFVLLLIFILISVILFYNYYFQYKEKINFLEKNYLKNYENLIIKINDDLISRYHTDYQESFNQKKEEIISRVFLAYSLIQNFYYENKDKMPENQLKKEALNLLKLIKFDNGEEYYSVFNSEGKVIFDPLIKNPKLLFILKKIKNGNTDIFIVRYENPFNKSKLSTKIISGIYFPKFDWIIITGFYLENFNKNFDKKFIKRIKNIFLPKNINLMILNKKNKFIYNYANYCKGIIPELIKLKEFKITEVSCNNSKYIFYMQKIHSNKWKVYSYFNKNKVLKNFKKIRKKLKDDFLYQVFIISFLLIFTIIILLIYLKTFKKEINSQFDKLIKFIKKVPYSQEKLNLDNFKFKEIYEIGKFANEMVKTINILNNKLEKEKIFLDTILKYLPYGVAVLTKDLKIEFINDYFIKNLGFEKDILNKDIDYLLKSLPADIEIDKSLLLNILKDVEKTKKVKILEKFKVYKKDGTPMYVQLAIAPLFEKNKINKMICLFYDITEEIKLKLEITKLSQAVKSAPVSIVVTDTEFKIEYVNPFFEKITGYSNNEVKDKSPSIIGTSYNKKFYKKIIETISNGKVWIGEFLNKKKNGELFWERAFISPVFNEKGKIINYVAVKEDITERKKFIEKLQKAKEKAENASKVKSEFLANMSHEIRTPMNAIIGFIELLLDTELNEIQKQYLEIMKQSSKNLLTILNDILDLSKFEKSRIEFENNFINLKNLFKHCASLFSAKISEKGLNFSIEIDNNIPEILIGDEVRISQVINNLLNNAIKFTEKGEIKLVATLEKLNNNSAEIKVCISDTGIGIPEDKKDKIFEDFTQGDSSITKKFGGTGLGLAIAKKIVEHYNGKIWVESEVGKGSKFYFTLKLELPDKIKPLSEEKKTPDFKKDNFYGAKILVAEDNITNQILIKEILKKFNINVVMANNGVEAIKYLAKEDYDLILMDWHMPVMDGIKTLEILRSLEHGNDINIDFLSKEEIEKLKGKKYKVIALTAAALESEKKKLLEKGFDAYLSKPIKLDNLLEVLNKYLKNYKTSNNSTFSKKLQDIIGDDENLMKEILESFKETYNNSIKDLDNAIEKKDFIAIFKTAHLLKGVSANLGFNDLSSLCVSLETAAKNKDLKKIYEIRDEIKNYKMK